MVSGLIAGTGTEISSCSNDKRGPFPFEGSYGASQSHSDGFAEQHDFVRPKLEVGRRPSVVHRNADHVFVGIE